MQPSELSAEDAQAMAAVDAHASRWPWSLNQYTQSLNSGDRAFGFVRRDAEQSELQAFALYQIVLDECSLLNFAVHPRWQKKGLAQALLRQTLVLLKTERNLTRCFLEVRESNLVAINVYEKCGFLPDGLRKNYYPVDNGRETAVLMSCDLTNFL
jgi:ribosomal-protein-alanine N-acetyltransferase